MNKQNQTDVSEHSAARMLSIARSAHKRMPEIELNNILSEIKTRASDGGMFVQLSESLKYKETYAELSRLGYVVTQSELTYSTFISWERGGKIGVK